MPVGKLLVEGELDVEIFTKVFDGTNIVRGGSKNSLRPQTRNDRAERRSTVYLRDRDFDFLPVNDLAHPTIDELDGSTPIGWRLNLHELENYLIEPRVASATFAIDNGLWQSQLCDAARRIASYQIARWTVGQLRANLPPNYKLDTKPGDIAELRLPADLSESSCFAWCKQAIVAFREKVEPHLASATVEAELAHRKEIFQKKNLSESTHILRWCSGKDLLAALDDSALQSVNCTSPKVVVNRLRDWVMKNPDSFLSFYPELQEIRKQLLA
jgi:hypothetical protein